MNKKFAVVIGSVVMATLIFSGNLYAKKDPNFILDVTKKNHEKTLEKLDVHVKETDLANLEALTDKQGNKWTYNSYLQSALVEEQIEQKYSAQAATSFIEAQEQIMDEYLQVGDTVPVILINKELTKAKFAFSREHGKGKVVSFEMSFDEKTEKWSVKKY